MKKEYRLSGFTHVFYGICAAAPLVLAIFLFSVSLTGAQPGLFFLNRPLALPY